MPRAVVAIGFCSLLTDVSSESVTAILPLYVTSGLGLSLFAYSVVDGLYQGASTLVRIPAGYVADRLDRPKRVAFLGYALSALTRLGLLLTTGLGAIAALITADRVGKGVRTAPRDSLISLATDRAALGRAFGVHRALDTLGACLGPLFAFALLMQLPGDFDAVFVVSLAAALLGLAVLVFLVPDLRQRGAGSPGSPGVPPHRVPLRAALVGKSRQLVALALPLSLLSVGDGVVYAVLLERDLVSGTWLPLLGLGTSAVYLATAVPLGAIADRIGRCRFFVLGHLALAATYALILAPARGHMVVLLAVAGLGLYYAATDGLLAAVSSAVAAAGHRSTTIAVTQTTAAVGRGLASVLFGALWTVAGDDAAVACFLTALLVAVPVGVAVVRRAGLEAF